MSKLSRFYLRNRILAIDICAFFVGVVLSQVFLRVWTGYGENVSFDKSDNISISGKIDQEIQAIRKEEAKQDLATLLERKIKVLCLVVTSEKNHTTQAEFVKMTWAKKCTKVIFVSDAEDAGLPAIKVTTHSDVTHAWAKTREGFQWAFDNHINDFDWFLKANDDTFMVMENVRAFLMQFKPSDPVFIGSEWQFDTQRLYFVRGATDARFRGKGFPDYYNNGGYGYILSKQALTKVALQSFTDPTKCQPPDVAIQEDMEMAICLDQVGISTTDSRDDLGRARLLPYTSDLHAENHSFLFGPIAFAQNKIRYPYKTGPSCCSDLPMSYYPVWSPIMLQLDYFLKTFHTFGRDAIGAPYKKAFDLALNALRTNGYLTNN